MRVEERTIPFINKAFVAVLKKMVARNGFVTYEELLESFKSDVASGSMSSSELRSITTSLTHLSHQGYLYKSQDRGSEYMLVDMAATVQILELIDLVQEYGCLECENTQLNRAYEFIETWSDWTNQTVYIEPCTKWRRLTVNICGAKNRYGVKDFREFSGDRYWSVEVEYFEVLKIWKEIASIVSSIIGGRPRKLQGGKLHPSERPLAYINDTKVKILKAMIRCDSIKPSQLHSRVSIDGVDGETMTLSYASLCGHISELGKTGLLVKVGEHRYAPHSVKSKEGVEKILKLLSDINLYGTNTTEHTAIKAAMQILILQDLQTPTTEQVQLLKSAKQSLIYCQSNCTKSLYHTTICGNPGRKTIKLSSELLEAIDVWKQISAIIVNTRKVCI